MARSIISINSALLWGFVIAPTVARLSRPVARQASTDLPPIIFSDPILEPTIIATLPKGTWIENLAVRSEDGNFLGTVLSAARGYLLSSTSKFDPVLVAEFPGNLGVLSIVELGDNVFYAVVGNFSIATATSTPGSWSIWEINLNDVDGHIPRSVDEIVNFGGDATKGQQQLPLFDNLPAEYQTLMNNASLYGYGAKAAAVYLLGKPANSSVPAEYVMCAIRARQDPHCSPRYHVADAGSQLTVHSDDDTANNLRYFNFDDEAPVGPAEPDFQEVVEDWIMATVLNGGSEDMKAQSARLLMQMVPRPIDSGSVMLSRTQPSVAEATAVLAALPLLMSSAYTTFTPFWNYTAPNNILPHGGQRQHFNALVAMRAYTSGPVQDWQVWFFFVLWSTAILSLGSLGGGKGASSDDVDLKVS